MSRIQDRLFQIADFLIHVFHSQIIEKFNLELKHQDIFASYFLQGVCKL